MRRSLQEILDNRLAIGFPKEALTIDPNDKKSANLLKMAMDVNYKSGEKK